MTENYVPNHIKFTPENTVPTTPQEISEDRKFDREVRQTLEKAARAREDAQRGATASNPDGDTLFVKGKESGATPPKIHYAFQIGADYVNKFIESIDGMRQYKNKEWATYPERINNQQVQYGKGFEDNYQLSGGEETFVKNEKDGTIDGAEAKLGIQQLEWDKTKGMNPNAANNAEKMLENVFDKDGNVKPEFDVNNNNKFDSEDVRALAALVDETGDGKGNGVLSGEDLDKASYEYIMNGKKLAPSSNNPSQATSGQRPTINPGEYKNDYTTPQLAQYFNFASKMPPGEQNNIEFLNVTLDKADTANQVLHGLAELRNSNPEQFSEVLANIGIEENNFDSILTLSDEMIANDGLLLNVMSKANAKNQLQNSTIAQNNSVNQPNVQSVEQTDNQPENLMEGMARVFTGMDVLDNGEVDGSVLRDSLKPNNRVFGQYQDPFIQMLMQWMAIIFAMLDKQDDGEINGSLFRNMISQNRNKVGRQDSFSKSGGNKTNAPKPKRNVSEQYPGLFNDGGQIDGVNSGPAGVYSGVKLTQEQMTNAKIIAEVGMEKGASKRDVQIAIATAMQESSLKNLNYGDRDSLGLFQQRPSCGWGTPEQVTNPRYAAGKFYDALLKDDNRNSKSVTKAAQSVQRSAFPNAYAKWENMAASLTDQMIS